MIRSSWQMDGWVDEWMEWQVNKWMDGSWIVVFHSLSDEDDTAELLRELQKIKKERAEEQAKKVNSIFIVKPPSLVYISLVLSNHNHTKSPTDTDSL